MKKAFALSLVCAALTGACANPSAGKAVSQTRAGLVDAALSPLEDLNLRNDNIPAVLLRIDNPYQVPKEISCAEVESQVTALNRVLPPDWDAGPKEDTSTLTDKAAETASDSLLKAVAGEARELIPYRSWVRKVSGANEHDKKLKAAFEKGAHRRTYLKALGEMKGCTGVAQPSITMAADKTTHIQYRGDGPDMATEMMPDPAPSAPKETSGPLNLTPAPVTPSQDTVEEEALPDLSEASPSRAGRTSSLPTGR